MKLPTVENRDFKCFWKPASVYFILDLMIILPVDHCLLDRVHKFLLVYVV